MTNKIIKFLQKKLTAIVDLTIAIILELFSIAITALWGLLTLVLFMNLNIFTGILGFACFLIFLVRFLGHCEDYRGYV